MIRLTRMNDVSVIVNADLIETIETTPDTVITLTNREKLIVRETSDEIVKLVVDYRRSIFPCASRTAASPLTEVT